MGDTKKRPAIATIGKHSFSVISGALACLASVLGKVAFDGDTAFHLMATTYCDDHLPLWVPCNMVGLAVQGASLAGMFMVNAVMFSTFLKALQNSGSTIATVTNCGTNFLLSGVSGRILFGERLPHMWFCGATLVIAGVLLMVSSTDSINSTEGKPDVKTGDDTAEKRRNVAYSPPKTRSKQD